MKLPDPVQPFTEWCGRFVYTEAQLKQAIRDALEEAAKVCEDMDQSLRPRHCSEAIRELKESVK